jgi:hypothetical protein
MRLKHRRYILDILPVLPEHHLAKYYIRFVEDRDSQPYPRLQKVGSYFYQAALLLAAIGLESCYEGILTAMTQIGLLPPLRTIAATATQQMAAIILLVG